MALLSRWFGPRIPAEELRRSGWRYALPTLTLSLARILLLCSLFLPYWHMQLQAPQYPNGLEISAYVNYLEGDVSEIDGLNHYIGMRPLDEAAEFERTTAVWLIIAMVLLVEGAAAVHSKWAVLLVLPAVLFPIGFLADLQFWLWSHGQHLDPKAPLSSSVKPFVPPALGIGTIGQFKTIASVGLGWWLAAAASILTIAALFLHRRAYKPLFDRTLGRAAGPDALDSISASAVEAA
ncbi:MAG: cytochrome C [Phycisphaerales bacterium]|nr:cytochrome C [Phycisphaerales bacterium]